MPNFSTRARAVARAARQMPNNVAAIRHQLDTRPQRVGHTSYEDPPDHAETRRLDDLAHALATPRDIAPGVALATTSDSADGQHRLATIADELQDELQRPVQRVMLEPGTGTDEQTNGVVVRTPHPLGWPRAIYVLVHVAPAEHLVLVHPAAMPDIGALGEMINTLDDADLASGTVIAEQYGTRQLADPGTICLVRTQHARDVLARTYRREAMSCPLNALITQASDTVAIHPRLVGTIRHPSPDDDRRSRPTAPSSSRLRDRDDPQRFRLRQPEVVSELEWGREAVDVRPQADGYAHHAKWQLGKN